VRIKTVHGSQSAVNRNDDVARTLDAASEECYFTRDVQSVTSFRWNMEGHSFLRAFEINRYITRDVKLPCKQVYLSP
jgi:hypothetical protein